MNLEKFIDELIDLDIKLKANKDEIEVEGTRENITHEILSKIRENKTDILNFLKSAKAENHLSYDIPNVKQQNSYDLSSAQRRLWTLSQIEEASIAYNVPGFYEFHGDLDIVSLEISFKKLINRHEALKTVFKEDSEGVIKQYIIPNFHFAITYKDLIHQENQSEEIKSIIRSDIEKPFDLANGPLFRVSLLRISENKYVFSYVMHHIISDGRTMEVIITELLSLYNSTLIKATDILEPLRIQYKDYSAWHQKELSGEKLEKYKAYWLQQLSGELPVLNMPTFKTRPKIKTYNGDFVTKSINSKITNQFRYLAQSNDSTLFMSLLALLKVLVFRYSEQQDIIIGSPTAGRPHSDLQNQVGFYVNMLALRTKIELDDSFLSILSNVKNVTLGAYEHQVYPFDELVNALNYTRDASRHPLFDITILFEGFDAKNDGNNHQNLGNLKILPYNEEKWIVSVFDLRFYFKELKDEIFLTIDYNTDIYDREIVENMSYHIEKMMVAVLENSNKPVIHLDYLSDKEKKKLQINSGKISLNNIESSNVVSLFEHQALCNPDNPAVIENDAIIKYKDLDQRANQLSCFLVKKLNLPNEGKVGLLLPRSINLFIAVLGTLKAGGSYVPIDINYPEERIIYMLNDSDIEILLVNKEVIEFANRLQSRSSKLKHLVCIDSDNYYNESGKGKNELMAKSLWDHVGLSSTDVISGGGWMSSYTGNYLTELEMDEYSENVFLKLKNILQPNMRVLEIGCSSGITMLKIAPKVAFYYGTDLSSSIISNTQNLVQERGITNIKLSCLPAHRIHQIEDIEFDLVIINSVVQCFNGHNYLRDVLSKVISKMKPNGFIFLGDIMDEDKREELINDLKNFKKLNVNKEYRTKTDWGAELFLSKTYLEDLAADNLGISKVICSDKIYTIANELTMYRFDSLLEVDKGFLNVNKQKKKRQYDLSDIQKYTTDSLNKKIESTQLAYSIYTSGSSGKPKGVEIEHKALSNLCSWHNKNFLVTDKDRASLYAGVAFDASVWEIFPYLSSGASIYCIPDSIRLDVNELSGYYERNNITISFLPTQLAEQFLTVENSSLRYLLTGGDKLNVFEKKKYQLVNNYGPTENTVVSTSFIVNNSYTNIPIGSPIDSTKIYILSDNLNLIPLGGVGEICVGGQSLARGYVNQPELTNEKFVQDPFHLTDRIYKTGDLGRWLPDGNIEFLGRKDDQVKIRGYRIELGEIQTALRNIPTIDNAHVLVNEDSFGEKKIVGYLVSKTEFDLDDISKNLSYVLPSYMIPSHFIKVSSIPITANGKVDVKLLPKSDDLQSKNFSDHINPRNETEKKLVKLWQLILQKENISVKDDFFELGGHSLKATRLANSIQKEMKIKLELKDLFNNTILEDQALLIDAQVKQKYNFIPKIEARDKYILSSSQKRLWILSQFPEANTAYNIPSFYEFKGNLNVLVFEKALKGIIKRHEILRTVFSENDSDEVMQIILTPEELNFNLSFEDIRAHNYTNDALLSDVQNEIEKPFNLLNGPLLRVRLIQTEETKYVFVCVMHHIISDGWSMSILINELFSLYNSFTSGLVNHLPELTIQYKDYSSWQQNQLNSNLNDSKEYWINQLSGDLSVLDIFTNKQRPLIQTFRGKVVDKVFDKVIANGLSNFCKTQGGTLFMGILTAVNTLFYKYTNLTDIILGSDIAGRNHPDLENQIGFYVNALALRTQFREDDSFTDLYSKVKKVTLDAYEHQMYPFDVLVDNLSLKRDLSRNPLFDVLVTVQNIQLKDNKINSLSLGDVIVNEYAGIESVVSKFDLSLNFSEVDEGLCCSIEYNTDIYDAKIIENILTHLESILSIAIKNPHKAINEIDFISVKEKNALREFNVVDEYFSLDKNIVALIDEQVQIQQDKIAIQHNNQSISYRELWNKTNKFAKYLYENFGTKPDNLFGVMMDRSLAMMETILSVWKSGGAYIPIDVDYPHDRIKQIIDTSNLNALIVNDLVVYDYISKLNLGIPIINIESILSVLSSEPDLPLNSEIKLNNLAYVIFTSGSTGKPKGVMIEHLGMINHIGSKITELGINSNSKVAQNAAHTFDISIWQFFSALVVGATTVIYSNDLVMDTEEFIKKLDEDRTTVLELVPSYLIEMLEALEDKSNIYKLSNLKIIVLNAETLMPSMVKRWLVLHPEIPIVNTYGITEVSDDISHFIMRTCPDNVTVPVLKKPIQNFEVHIVNEKFNLQPIGVKGEILLSGPCVGRGYLNDLERTEKAFLKGPILGITNHDRIYRTGDIGRYLSDGTMEFLGRKDTQVKIKGNRIELGEIEHVLMQVKGINNTKVVTNISKQYLIVYYTSDRELTNEYILGEMKQKLPNYMMPQHIIPLKKFPLNVNGKIDVKQLPEPQELLSKGIDYVPARNETDEKILKIWQDALGKEKVSITDNFFEVGGNSLKLVKVSKRLNSLFNRNDHIAIMFQYPSIKELSDYVNNHAGSNQISDELINDSISNLEDSIMTFNEQNHG